MRATLVLCPDSQAMLNNELHRTVRDKKRQIQISGLSTDGHKWFDGVTAANGPIYGLPHKADSVLIIDPGC